jgi:endonuclease YncB( thermonuclease family)
MKLAARFLPIYLLAMGTTVGQSQAPGIIVENARAVSGGALEADAVRYELAGIDAPDLLQGCRDREEVFYRCGQDAWAYLDQMVAGQNILCRRLEVKSPNLIRVQCTVGGLDLAATVVRRGHAVAIPGSVDYSDAEVEARQNRRGLWSGSFLRPAEWRQRMKRPVFVPSDHR